MQTHHHFNALFLVASLGDTTAAEAQVRLELAKRYTTGSVGIPWAGTVLFRNFTLSARRGRLNANGGVLRAADGSTLSVPVTGPLEGPPCRGTLEGHA